MRNLQFNQFKITKTKIKDQHKYKKLIQMTSIKIKQIKIKTEQPI